MKKIIGLLAVSLSLQAADVAKMDIDITVISSDGVQFDVPEKIAFLSPIIKAALTSEKGIKEVGTSVDVDVAAREFATIKAMLGALQHAVDQQKNKNPFSLDIVRPDGSFSARTVYIVIEEILRKKTSPELIALIKACNYLELSFFLDPIAKIYTHKLLDAHSQLKLAGLDPVLKEESIPQDLYVYFRKYIQLLDWYDTSETNIQDVMRNKLRGGR